MPSTLCAEPLQPSLSRGGSAKLITSNLRSTAVATSSNPLSNSNLAISSSSPDQSTSLNSAKFLVGKGLSRFSALNRSFNNVANLASDLKKNIENAASFVYPESAPASASHEVRSKPSRFNSSLIAEGANPEYPSYSNGSLSQPGNEHSSEEDDRMNTASSTGFVRQLSLRVKTQVAATLSDPLRTKNPNNAPTPCDEACGTCVRCQQSSSAYQNQGVNSPLTKKASIKKKVADISNRLQLPKFLSDNPEENDNNDGRFLTKTNCL